MFRVSYLFLIVSVGSCFDLEALAAEERVEEDEQQEALEEAWRWNGLCDSIKLRSVGQLINIRLSGSK